MWGLSKAGVDEAKGELAKKGEVIRELEVNFKDNENEVLFWVKAGRYIVSKDGREILLDTAIGFKRQPKKYDNGKGNPFWYEQGGIKACRNASFRLIPKSVTQAVIEYAKKQGKVKEVKPDKSIKSTTSGPTTKNFDFLASMAKAKESLGPEIYYGILLTRWHYEHANLVTDPKEQETIYNEMKEAFMDKKRQMEPKEANANG